MEPKIPLLLRGFNLTCFAYGMTGSGKTFSMFGSGGVQNNISANGLCWMSVSSKVKHLDFSSITGFKSSSR